jgi:hypothetical protein
MKRYVPITLIATGAVLIALPLTFAFVLRLRGGLSSLPPEEMAACQFGGFALVAGAILLVLLLPEPPAAEPLKPLMKAPPSAKPDPSPTGPDNPEAKPPA